MLFYFSLFTSFAFTPKAYTNLFVLLKNERLILALSSLDFDIKVLTLR